MSVNEIYLGIDIGSISAKFAILDGNKSILETQYHRHKGQPLIIVRRVMGEILDKYGLEGIKQIGLCGAGGELAGKLLGGAAINEIIAHSQAVIRLYPQVRTIIEIGGEDSKLILLDDQGNIQDFAMNAICAAGTGSFLDQQASRLGISIEEEFGTLALKSVHPPRIAGRCSVFAKTDMIHLQQEATPVWDIVSGLCHAMARSFKSNLGRGKEFQPVVAFQGGVAANQGMIRAFENVLELPPGNLLIPKDFACMGAIGAAMVAMEQEPVKFNGLEQLDRYIHDRVYQPEGRLPLSSFNPPARHDFKPVEGNGGRIEAYLGVDIGSVSTNVVVIDKNRKVLSKHYLMTAGRPIDAVSKGIARAGREVGHLVNIMGVGTTGSGRYMIADLIGADIVKNEITAQARAAMEIDPQVDTIFEIGGQDSKYISLDQGVIVDFEMNKVCAAGTGSFLEEQAERLGISIKDEFGRLALSAPAPVHLGERCTVFMESDLNHHQQKGAAQDNLVAGLAYSIVYNYLNRVVGDRKIGDRIFFQGGVAYNDGVVAAFEQVTGKPIHVPEHHEVTGALGVAIIAQEKRTWAKSKFKGFSFGQRSYQIESFQCPDCSNHCEIRKVSVDGEEPLFYGSRCDKYELREERRKSDLPDLFKERERMLLNTYQPKPLPANAKTVGIPRCLFVYEQYPFWQAFFGELGFKVALSRKTTKEIIQRGIEQVSAETCFPIKLAHGHVMALLAEGIDYLFLPSIISPEPNTPDGLNSFSCPYVQAIPYTIAAAINIPDQVKQLKPIIRYSYGVSHVIRELVKMSESLGRSSFEIKMAFETARQTQAKFFADIRKRGAEALASLKPDQMGVVIISRPYNGCDRGLNLELPRKLLNLGFIAIPIDFLPIDQPTTEADWPNMYWRYGKYILRAADIIKEYPQLYPLYITNFGCGPDSFITHFFRHKLGGKPCLQIEVDEHSADVGAITRCEAFKDSLENMQLKHITIAPKIKGKFSLPKSAQRKLYVLPMCDHAKPLAASFRREGINSEVLPESDSQTLVWGRKFTSGRECYPCIVTTGDIVKATQQPGFEPDRSAFFMPSGAGPCRFGQYNMFQRMVLDDLNLENVHIFNPNQNHNLLQEFGVVGEGFIRNLWQGTVAVDFMDQLRRETRPYEVNPGQTDKVYFECLDELCRAIEQDRLWPVMAEIKRKLAAVPIQKSGQRPVIGIVGEIFVRSSRFCNLDVARQVEQLGGEAWFAPFNEWMLYMNHISRQVNLITRDYRTLFNLKLNNWVQLKDEHRMQEIFRGSLRNLEEPPMATTLEYSAKYLDPSIEGEAVLSIGKSVDFARKGLAGIINTMPFTCMPGTIVMAITKRLREDYHGIPCLNMSLDGLEQSNIKTRLEAFMYQARQYNEKKLR